MARYGLASMICPSRKHYARSDNPLAQHSMTSYLRFSTLRHFSHSILPAYIVFANWALWEEWSYWRLTNLQVDFL